MWLLYVVACIEWFSTLAVEIIALRLAAPVVWSSSIVTSVFLGIVLLSLSAGYRRGWMLAASLSHQQIRYRVWWFILFEAVFYGCISFLFEVSLLTWLLEVTGNYLFTLFAVALLLFFLPIYIASQTVPLLTELLGETSSGKAAGKMLFASTVWSFFGSVLTSIVFFQYLWVALTGVLITVLLGCIISYRFRLFDKRWSILTGIVTLFLLGIGLFIHAQRSSSLYVFDSAYQHIEVADGYVKDGRDIRVFRTNAAFASAMYLDTRLTPFTYVQEAVRRTILLEPKRVLVIGAAGFSYPYEIEQALPGLERIDVIDVDGSVKTIAETYFLQEELPEKINFFPASARFFIREKIKAGETYDLIFVDAFNGKSVPWELTTKEFFTWLDALTPDGVVLINAIFDTNLESTLANNIWATLQHVFGDMRYLLTSSDPDTVDDIQNFILSSEQLTEEYIRMGWWWVVYTDDKRSTEEDVVELYWE